MKRAYKDLTFSERIGKVFSVGWYQNGSWFSWTINRRNEITDSPQFFVTEGSD